MRLAHATGSIPLRQVENYILSSMNADLHTFITQIGIVSACTELNNNSCDKP